MSKLFITVNLFIYLFAVSLPSIKVSAQYTQQRHKVPTGGVIPVSKPGSYAVPGATYMLVNDISSPMSAIFLGKDVTLDLNGYTITFADTSYEHVPNFSFEEGLKGWDISNAPSAKIEDTKVHVFIGDKILRLSKGEEIVSQYINLPVPGRSYIAMCGVIKPDMKVSVYVEDEHGESVVCNTEYRDGIKQSCPVEEKSPRLGGGFVFAHLTGLKAGKYRVRVKANTDCLVDHIDIRPSMDVGIGIVGKTDAIGHNDHLYEGIHSAFFDYTADAAQSRPIAGIPVVKGEGTVIIKNGVIRNGTLGMISWGIQSTADDVEIILDNIKIINSGINATAADLLYATITKCTFDVLNPFIINRHGSSFYAVDLRGDRPSEVSFSEFYGGQGCLVFKGDFSKIHHNFFANRQTVTNHYSVMAMGDSSLVFENLIKPEVGSGIEVFVHRGMEIFNNEIYIEAAPPTCEYGHEEYSTTALRIADYNAKPGSPNGCFGNKVYNNKIYVIGKDYPEYPDYIPMAWAVFYSASAGDNYIYGNEIEVADITVGAKNETSAFYIGGGTIGGQFYDNRITTNVPAAWVASRYGDATDTKIFNNQIIKSDEAEYNFKPFRMGWDGRYKSIAKGIQFRSNEIVGVEFDIDATGQNHQYSVYWTLTVKVVDEGGNPVSGADVRILNKKGEEVFNQRTLEGGTVSIELMEYCQGDSTRIIKSPYKVVVGKTTETIQLNKNKKVTIKMS
ncbi:MAG: hypothetical protein GXO81_01900 [Chlorobi bacterium]|nr:hypothetical protein [Chlorobiota bacterium]